MYSKLNTFFRLALCATFALFLGSNVFASHLVGGDLYYTHVSGNTYKVTFVAYGDCGPASAASFSTLPTSTPQICIYNGDTLITNLFLAIDTPSTGVEVTPLCPGDTSQCTSPTSTIPGIKKFVYSGNITLPYTSSVWRFIYGGGMGPGATAGRASAITNLMSAGATIVQLIDTLNNVSAPNSSTMLTVAQQTFFCLSNPNNYNPGAMDPDGDGISITLTGAVSGIGSDTCVTAGSPVYYNGTAWGTTPVSGTAPITCDSASFSLNASTGYMIFTPNVMQRSVVVYNVEERRSGVLVGTSQREMTVLVLTCGSGFPCIPGTTTSTEVIHNNSGITIYPNPAYDELTIKADNGAFRSLTISNSIGQQVISRLISSSQTNIDIKSLPAGVYYVTFIGNGGTQVQKFVKW